MLFCAYKEYKMLKNKFLIYTLAIALALTGCAKRGTITGGPKDTIPPILTGSSPRNMSTDFKGSEIRIDFNEYIKIKDVNKQLIISPPMATSPEIYPMGSASKYITIRIKDTLQPNTTYSFNFGQSITDNNEGNPYSQFKFVFSTGSYIDSLTLNGRIKDAYSLKADNFVNVMLYEANEKFNDSTIYKERPRYVTNTLDSMVNFSLQNLKAGKYHLFALKDQNSNYRYDPKIDKIAFLGNTVTVPTDTVYLLELFTEQRKFRALRPSQASSNRIVMGYEGDPRGLQVSVKNGAGTEDITSITTRLPKKDSVQVWVPRNIKSIADSLMVSVNHRDSVKNFNIKIKEIKAADSLSVTAVQKGTLHFRDKFTLTTTTPLTKIDTTLISLMRKDSTAIPFTLRHDLFEQKIEFDFAKSESEKYTFTLLPGAFEDFYGKQNDTLNYGLTTRTYAEYGNMRVTLANADRFPLILELTNEKGDILASYYSEGETSISFDAILPEKYIMRVIYDDNGNKEWDSGNYLEKRQPEEVIYWRGKPVEIRQNWDAEETFDLRR